MSDDVFTVAATNLVKDSRKPKPKKGSGEDTGYFYKPGEKVKRSELGGDADVLVAAGALIAGADKKGES